MTVARGRVCSRSSMQHSSGFSSKESGGYQASSGMDQLVGASNSQQNSEGVESEKR